MVGTHPPRQRYQGISICKKVQTMSTPATKPSPPTPGTSHKELLDGEFWRHIPAYRHIDTATFLDHAWQSRNAVTHPKRLRETLGDLMPGGLYRDVEEGLRRAPMSMRLSPYLMALINWSDPESYPLRKQFVPVGQNLIEDHPKLGYDALHEQADAPVPGLTHRYPDKALFLPLDTCPVYCRFCTRSYSVGLDTEAVEKVALRVNDARWRQAFAYIAAHPELEDIVISGGDAYNLRPEHIERIGLTLLDMPHIRRIRFATKGLAVMPQKILTYHAWLDAMTRVVDHGRQRRKDVAIHTHLNHPAEATWITREALGRLYDRGIVVRNQSVLLRGVNDDARTMNTLIRRLGYLNVQPYYVYLCDMVKGMEDLRTSLDVAIRLEKQVRGVTAGFHTPAFVCDTPGGGGKCSVHAYDIYHRDTGIAVFTAPSVKPGQLFLYYDPLHSLSEASRVGWKDGQEQQRMVAEAIAAAETGGRCNG